MKRQPAVDASSTHRVKIDLGCGNRKVKGALGVDTVPVPGVDVVADINRGLPRPDAAGLNGSMRVTSDGTSLAVVDNDIGQVFRMTPAGDTSVIADGLPDPMGITYQNDALFVLDRQLQAVFKVIGTF